MFKEKLLLGQYYPGDSPIHRLHGCSKIVAALIYMIVLFIVDTWPAWGALALLAVVAVAVARLPLAAVWRGLKIILIFCVFTLLMNLFFYPGDPLVSIGFIKISRQGLIYGLAMSLRLLLLVLFSSLLTLTTKPMELTDATETLLRPLAKLGAHTHEIAMMMSIALRFIPTILDEFERIVLAQKARGASVGQGSVFRRLKAFIPMLVPLFMAAFRRAEDLAAAMEAKGYRGGEGRTKWRVVPWRVRDTVITVAFCALFAGSIVYRVLF